MHQVIGKCPVCGEPLSVTRLYCRACDTAVEGHFGLGRFYHLSPEELAFVEIFIRCEGKLNRVQEELGISYPTARARLMEVILALGYQIQTARSQISAEERQVVLEQLAAGEITSEEAISLLQG